jgi:hypothetical protein
MLVRGRLFGWGFDVNGRLFLEESLSDVATLLFCG